MNLEPVKAVLKASSKILNETVQMEFRHEDPYMKDHPSCLHDVSVLVGFSGDLEGVVFFSFASDAALSLAGRFMEVMGVPAPGELDGNAQSALAELINIIMGHYMIAMEAQGSSVIITPVTVVVGTEVTFGVDGLKQIVAIPISLPVGKGEINVAMK